MEDGTDASSLRELTKQKHVKATNSKSNNVGVEKIEINYTSFYNHQANTDRDDEALLLAYVP